LYPKLSDSLNLSYFISKRIRHAEGNSFSSVIHKIAVISIAIGLAAAIVSFLIMQGFQSAIKNKIYGFSNHLLITQYTMSNAVEEQPFDYHIEIYKNPSAFPFIKHVQEFSHKAGLIKTDDEVMGIVFKGVGSSFDISQFKASLQEGNFIHFPDSGYSNQVLLSRVIANKINARTGDDIVVHFFQNPPRFRRLTVAGIYETNLSDYFDSKVIIGDIRLVQRLNDWSATQAGGLEVQLDLSSYNSFQLWRADFSRYWSRVREDIQDNPDVDNEFLSSVSALINYKFDFDKAAMEESARSISQSIDYDLYMETVRDKYIQIFEWLDLIKRQVKILLVVILIVVCVNMISVILISVMERTQMVGMLKAMGAQNQLIRSVFLYNGVNLIVKGLFFGNLVGLGICFLQDRFKIISLNPHDYYMDYVPIAWSWSTIILLNVIVFVTVWIVLLLPTRFISRINPIQAIRFD
jgi:lipoprotein-releasing system permease protein